MKEPKVSILIPVYNREAYIGDCIRSALDQSCREIEVVVVDNASTDRTWDICRELAAGDERLRIFRNERNLGPVGNWQRCVAEARGRFCKILFSDDLLMPECVEQLLETMNGDVGLAACPALIGPSLEEATPGYFQGFCSSRPVLYPDRDFYVKMLLFGDAPVSPGAILLRRDDLLANIKCDFPTRTKKDFAAHGAGPDLMISLLTARSYRKVAIVTQPLVFFRVHAGSFTIENRNNEIKSSYEVIWNHYLRSYESRLWWAGHVFNTWLRRLGKQKEPLRRFFAYNEGCGTIGEILCGLLGLMPYVVGKKLYRRHRETL